MDIQHRLIAGYCAVRQVRQPVQVVCSNGTYRVRSTLTAYSVHRLICAFVCGLEPCTEYRECIVIIPAGSTGEWDDPRPVEYLTSSNPNPWLLIRVRTETPGVVQTVFHTGTVYVNAFSIIGTHNTTLPMLYLTGLCLLRDMQEAIQSKLQPRCSL